MFFEAMMNYSFAQNQVDTVKSVLVSEVAVLPCFPNGFKEFGKFISVNLRYPKIALKNNAAGKVYISCSVLPDGSLTDFKIFKSCYIQNDQDDEEKKMAYESLDKEAIRILELSPKWTPGLVNGKPVKVLNLKIPINFAIE